MGGCPHGMPNPKTCVDCMEEGNIEPPKWKINGPMFAARFAGTCGGCGEGWTPGDIIQRWDKEDSETKYTHAYSCRMGG